MECSSLRVWGGGNVTMISHGVEISIAGGVRKMVRERTEVGGGGGMNMLAS